jgi:predicted alpha/beta hydrolase
MQKITLTAKDGYALAALWTVPVGEYLGTVVLSGATGVKKEFYMYFAQYLVQNGYRVLLFDYRGIGESAPAELKGFVAYMHEWGTLDMNAALDYVVHEQNATNIIWIGHSVGAQMVGLLDNRKHIKKLLAISASTGYWGYFPFPYNCLAISLWLVIGPAVTAIKDYGAMKKIGWGENLPKQVFYEWRRWCLSKQHFRYLLEEKMGQTEFTDFKAPIIAVHPADDYIANAKTVVKLLEFYPNSPQRIICVQPREIGERQIGHTGMFRKRLERKLWPMLVELMGDERVEVV